MPGLKGGVRACRLGLPPTKAYLAGAARHPSRSGAGHSVVSHVRLTSASVAQVSALPAAAAAAAAATSAHVLAQLAFIQVPTHGFPFPQLGQSEDPQFEAPSSPGQHGIHERSHVVASFSASVGVYVKGTEGMYQTTTTLIHMYCARCLLLQRHGVAGHDCMSLKYLCQWHGRRCGVNLRAAPAVIFQQLAVGSGVHITACRRVLRHLVVLGNDSRVAVGVVGATRTHARARDMQCASGICEREKL